MEVVTLGVIIILVGLAVGFLSGLVGIGGGVLMVPFLYFFYDRPDLFGVVVSPDVRVVLAHGTSLMVIVPTSIRGAIAYDRTNLVEWRAVWPIGAASVVAALLGAVLAASLPPNVLRTAFGVLLIASGVRLLYGRRNRPQSVRAAEPKLTLPRMLLTGFAMGLVSSLLGVGGGTVAIPLLIYLVKLDLRKVAATSIGIIGLTAAAGAIGYVVTGFGHPGLPPWSLGYVHVSVGIAMFLGAVVSVRWGALVNQRLKPRTLTMVFGALFVVLGLRLAGGNILALWRGVEAAAGLAT